MFDTTQAAVRQVGIPEGQRLQRGEGGIKTLNHFVPAEMFAVQYVGDDGMEHKTVVMCIGGQWYLPPNGEAWARALLPLKGDTWLAKQLSESHRALSAPLPKADAVDILPDKA